MNAETEVNKTKKRVPSTAAGLSLILPGLGQFYNGRIVKAILLMAIGTILVGIGLMAILFSLNGASIVFMLLMTGASIPIWLYAVVDAWIDARKLGDGYELKEYNRPSIYLLLIVAVGLCSQFGYVFLLRERFIEAFYLPTRSMEPNLLAGDRVLVTKTAFQIRDPRRGEIVIFRNPADRRRTYIQRVVGMPGDTIEVRGGELLINGEALEHEKADDENTRLERNGDSAYRVSAEAGEDFGPVTVPDYHAFLLGDNRALSRDSRHFGPIAFGSLRGRLAYVVWPAQDWSRFGAVK